jgi:hypothetical protein
MLTPVILPPGLAKLGDEPGANEVITDHHDWKCLGRGLGRQTRWISGCKNQRGTIPEERAGQFR